MKIINRLSGDTLYEGNHETTVGCVYAALQSGANLGRANLQGANLRGADLRGANLQGANLRGADLRGANLRGTDLGRANLGSANLQGANLRGTDLGYANLQAADLGYANLRGTDLGRANLGSANLQGANLRGAAYGKGISLSTPPIYIDGLPLYSVLILDEHVKIGCKLQSLDEWLVMSEKDMRALNGDDAVNWSHQWGEYVIGIAKAHRERCRAAKREPGQERE